MTVSEHVIELDGVEGLVIAGDVEGPVVALGEPLSFWGGFDSEHGVVIDEHHPQVGVCLSGAIVTMSVGRGSSSASSVIAEAVRIGTAPAALVMLEPDEIITTGALVAEELYGRTVAILVVEERVFDLVTASTRVTITKTETGTTLTLE